MAKRVTRKALNEAKKRCHRIATSYFRRNFNATPTLNSIVILNYEYDTEKDRITHVVFESKAKDPEGMWWEAEFNRSLGGRENEWQW